MKKTESIVKHLDKTVRPQDDFYRYVNGGWIKKAKIPADKSSWGNFDELREESLQNIRAIILDVAKKKKVIIGSPEQMIRDLYVSGMNMKRRNKDGFKPIELLLKKVDSLKTREDVSAFVGLLHTMQINTLWSIGVDVDLKKVTTYVTYMGQGGIHLPDREYYLKKTKDMVAIQHAYKQYMQKMWELTGIASRDAEKKVKEIMHFETRLARAMMTPVELRDYAKQYNVYSATKRKKEFKEIDWKSYCTATALPVNEKVIMMQPEFMALVNAQLAKGVTRQLKSYLAWCILASSAAFVSDKAGVLTYELYGKTLSGMEKRAPLWKRVTGVVESSLGEALGQIYVKKHFSERGKKKVEELVERLVVVYERRMRALDWMSDATKKKAIEKLHTFDALLAYPDKWRSYKGLAVNSEKSYFENVLAVSRYECKRNIKRLGKKVDKKEWHMTPQTVNAYFSPDRNQIVFPAAILQPPFFNPKQDDAVNYGAIGMVIGHEMTHGFDDNGSQFDKDGNMKNWWGAADRRKFMERAKMLATQVNTYKVSGYQVNGELTLGENIADLGGLVIAYEAYMETLTERQKKTKKDGLLPAQRFFIGYARAWRAVMRKEYRMQILLSDPHPPEECRVNGPFSNMNEFYETFEVQKGDKLWRPESERVQIW